MTKITEMQVVSREEDIANTTTTWRPEDILDVNIPAGYIPIFYVFGQKPVSVDYSGIVTAKKSSGYYVCVEYSRKEELTPIAKQLFDNVPWFKCAWNGIT